MILIADSGSTVTDWCILDVSSKEKKLFRTGGLNANYLTEKEMQEILFQELKPKLPHSAICAITNIYFYGTGCSTEKKQEKVRLQLEKLTPNASIVVHHDLVGAAISICGNDMGVACILGTGSNSCVYDGKNIKKTLLSLGYLLGDEGSGTYIGKKILYCYLKNRMPKELSLLFYQKYKKHPEDIIAEMYAAPKTGSYLAQFSHFASEYIEFPYLEDIIKNSFRDFIREQVVQYEEATHYPVGFVGSIAAIFQKQLQAVLEEYNMKMGKIIRNPIDGLAEYHLNECRKVNPKE
jgi:N-acetylglucosamine kinase-like BadF-type ATPase